jgi:hypothetical protein
MTSFPSISPSSWMYRVIDVPDLLSSMICTSARTACSSFRSRCQLIVNANHGIMERLRCLAKADCVTDCVWLGHTTVCRMAAHRKSDRRRDDLCAVELRKTYCELVISAASGLAASPYRLTRVVHKMRRGAPRRLPQGERPTGVAIVEAGVSPASRAFAAKIAAATNPRHCDLRQRRPAGVSRQFSIDQNSPLKPHDQKQRTT